MVHPIPLLKALSDETRLHILGILDGNRLSVNDIIEVLGMGQSRISRHLRILSNAGILEFERDGTRVYYGIPASQDKLLGGILRSLGIRQFANFDPGPGGLESLLSAEERSRLQKVIEARKLFLLEHFQKFDRSEASVQEEYVDAGYYRKKILELLPENPGVVADLGCGDGELAALVVDRAARLICVDQSSHMLDLATAHVRAGNAEFRIGAVDHLPLRDQEVDTVILSMVLHHMADPEAGIAEAFRVLKPAGTLILVELKRHDMEQMRSLFADFYLGFDLARIRSFLKKEGFSFEGKASGKGKGRLECLFVTARK